MAAHPISPEMWSTVEEHMGIRGSRRLRETLEIFGLSLVESLDTEQHEERMAILHSLQEAQRVLYEQQLEAVEGNLAEERRENERLSQENERLRREVDEREQALQVAVDQERQKHEDDRGRRMREIAALETQNERHAIQTNRMVSFLSNLGTIIGCPAVNVEDILLETNGLNNFTEQIQAKINELETRSRGVQLSDDALGYLQGFLQRVPGVTATFPAATSQRTPGLLSPSPLVAPPSTSIVPNLSVTDSNSPSMIECSSPQESAGAIAPIEVIIPSDSEILISAHPDMGPTPSAHGTFQDQQSSIISDDEDNASIISQSTTTTITSSSSGGSGGPGFVCQPDLTNPHKIILTRVRPTVQENALTPIVETEATIDSSILYSAQEPNDTFHENLTEYPTPASTPRTELHFVEPIRPRASRSPQAQESFRNVHCYGCPCGKQFATLHGGQVHAGMMNKRARGGKRAFGNGQRARNGILNQNHRRGTTTPGFADILADMDIVL